MGSPGRHRDEAPQGYVTVREAAEMLSISETAVRQKVKRRTLPTTDRLHTEGGEPRYYIPVEAMERAMAEKENDEGAQARPPKVVGIFLHRPERPKTVRIETGPEGVKVHLDG